MNKFKAHINALCYIFVPCQCNGEITQLKVCISRQFEENSSTTCMILQIVWELIHGLITSSNVLFTSTSNVSMHCFSFPHVYLYYINTCGFQGLRTHVKTPPYFPLLLLHCTLYLHPILPHARSLVEESSNHVLLPDLKG